MNIIQFKNHLVSNEKSEATVERYMRDVTAYIKWLDGREMSKELIIQYKSELCERYEPASVNTMLASLNAYLDFIGHPEYKVRNIKIQKSTYIEPKRELTKEEYERLLKTAYDMGKYRIYYIMQTICSCGIRVSELKFITVEAIKRGIAHISNKGKNRRVFIPNALSKLLQQYINLKKIKSGPVFVTRTGKSIDRSNIWAEMKRLCAKAGVLTSKVFPHNLRHMITKSGYPSYGHLIEIGETTLPEQFMPDGVSCGSHNHHFMGDIANWFMSTIGGLKVIDSNTVEICPHFIKQIEFASVSYELPQGIIKIKWERRENEIDLSIICPVKYTININECYTGMVVHLK